jgi:mono/diheme cytochrome c family protein
MRTTKTLLLLLALYALPASGQMAAHGSTARPAPAKRPSLAMVKLGRELVLNHDCAACHGSSEDPRAKGYMAGATTPDQDFLIGPCAQQADAKPCWRTRARNLTPDNATGIGRFSERQLFNALRYGLRPGETPDVVITSSTPGKGNFPENPRYLAPPMPWTGWRHMSDRELWAIAAYLKHGLKPVSNRVADSDGPPDFWASTYTLERIGPYPAAPFPTVNEKTP